MKITTLSLLTIITFFNVTPLYANDTLSLQEIEEKAHGLLTNGEAMSALRNSRELDAARDCGIKMRSYQPQVKKLRKQVDEAGSGNSYFLEVALGHLLWCVSCGKDADQSCSKVSKNLKEYQAQKP